MPVPTLGAFLEACATHPTDDLADLSEFAGFSISTGKRAIPTLESFSLVTRDGSGRFVSTADGVRRGMDAEARDQVIRRGLLGFRPFELLVEGLALGEDVDVTVRKTLRLLDLPQSEASKLRMLLNWGEDLRVLERENGRVRLIAELSPAAVDATGHVSSEDVESEAKARLFNARRLGRDANHYLDETDRGLLAEALLSAGSDPRKSVDASGQAMEDFLREVANEKGLGQQTRKLNGAGQLANLLASNVVIHSHHQKMVDAAATMRNATAHRKDKKTLTPWELTEGGAFTAHAMTLTAIRSIHHYASNGRQTI